MLYGVLTLSYPDGRSQHELLTKELMTVGRSPASDIIIDDDRVSREHALIECGPNGLWLTQLSETSLSLVDGQRLAKTERVALVNAAQIAFGPSPVAAGVRLGPDVALSERDTPAVVQKLFTWSLMPQPIIIQAGSSVKLNLALTNNLGRVLNLKLSWLGDGFPGEIEFSDRTPGLMHDPDAANRQQTVTVTLRVPRRYSSTAGQHTFWITVEHDIDAPQPGDQPISPQLRAKLSEPEQIPVEVTILPYIEFELVVMPESVETRRRGRFDLHLTNRSNLTLPMHIALSNRAQALKFDVPAARAARTSGRISTGHPTRDAGARLPAAEVDILPGESRRVPVYVAPKRWRPLGARQPHQFVFLVTSGWNEETLRQIIPAALGDDVVAQVLAEPRAQPRPLDAELVLRPVPLWAALLVLAPLTLLAIWLLALKPTIQTNTVRSGALTQSAEGRVAPTNLVPLAFTRDGQIAELFVQPGTDVLADTPIARLRDDEQHQALDKAQAQLDSAQAQLANDEKQQQQAKKAAQQALDQAKERLQQLKPGGRDDVLQAAAQARTQAEQALKEATEQGSATKTAAEAKVDEAKAVVIQAQQDFHQAESDLKWVRSKNTHPIDGYPVDGIFVHRPVTSVEKKQFEDALETAKRKLDETGKQLEAALQNATLAREQEVSQVQAATLQRDQATKAYDDVASGKGSPELDAAQKAVDDAQLKLNETELQNVDQQRRAIDLATKERERAQAELRARTLRAPQAGRIYRLTKQRGDTVTADQPIGTVMDAAPAREIVAALPPAQAQLLSVAQPVTVTLIISATTPMTMYAQLRAPLDIPPVDATSQPAPVEAHLVLLDPPPDQPALDTPVKIMFVPPGKANVLLLAPAAIRGEGANRFVLVRRFEFFQRRVRVVPGLSNDQAIEVQADNNALQAGEEVFLP